MIDDTDFIDLTPLRPDLQRAVRQIMAEVDRRGGVESHIRKVAAVALLSAALATITFLQGPGQRAPRYDLEAVLLSAAADGGSMDVGRLLDAVESQQ